MATIVYFEGSYGKHKDELKRILNSTMPRIKDVFNEAWFKLDELGFQ